MKIEIEAKMRVSDIDAVRHRLRSLSATCLGQMIEDNVFLDNPQRDLSSTDRGLRLRRVQWPDGDGQPRIELTFKGPRQEGQFKSRREIEVLVSDAEDTLAMLEELGYQQVIRFEKRRQRWRLSEATIELDELPYLGSFVEVEALDESTVLAVRKAMELEEAPVIKSSYVSMLTTYLREHGLTARRVTFEAADPQAV